MSQTAQSKHQQRVHVKQYTAYTHNYNNKTLTLSANYSAI